MTKPEQEPAAERAAAWARMLTHLRDASLQVGWVREQLTELGAARAADVLTVVLAHAEHREQRYAQLLLRVSLALAAPETAGLKRAIAAIADVRGQLALARFLGAGAQAAAEGDDEGARDVPDFGGGRPLTLGERKSLARKRDRTLLARILRDPHPDVIRILLDNPALVEEDIVRLCARRPVKAQVLVQVFQHPRWVLRYRIRLTLALNPFTPEEITLQLLPHLSPSDLRDVANAGHATESVRAACFGTHEKPLH